jgi:hypothetical protein
MWKWVLIVLVISESVWAASKLTTKNRLSVYPRPDEGSGVSFSIPAGESLLVSDGSKNGFKKVRVDVEGHARTGFVLIEDLKLQKDTRPAGSWAVGGGPIFSRFSQGGKTFTTKDQVNYSISGYSGQSVAPAVVLQFGDRDFWRLGGHYRSLELTGTATTDVPGAPSQSIKLTYKMLGAMFEMGWSLWNTSFYLGGGAGYDRTLSGTAFLGSQDLSSSTDFPSFISGHALAGYRFQFSSHWAAFFEARAGAVANQSPMMLSLETTAQVIYWP